MKFGFYLKKRVLVFQKEGPTFLYMLKSVFLYNFAKIDKFGISAFNKGIYFFLLFYTC